MLAFSRMVGERFFIGKDRKIIVEIVRCSEGRVRLAVEAPPDVVIMREELADGLVDRKQTEEDEPCQNS